MVESPSASCLSFLPTLDKAAQVELAAGEPQTWWGFWTTHETCPTSFFTAQ